MLLKKFITLIILWLTAWFNPKTEIISPKSNLVYVEPTPIVTKTIITPITPVASIVPTIIPTQKIIRIADTGPWGVAEKINDVTWTMKLNQDEKMGTPKEILDALNKYRNVHGSRPLEWDQKLADYATSRAKYFMEIKALDSHKGFEEKLKDEGGFRDLGFWGLGENASFGYKLEAVHLIEWMYAADEPHNDNQLDNSWTHVGIGIDDVSSVLIFGKHKI